jgi:hypothetical protein
MPCKRSTRPCRRDTRGSKPSTGPCQRNTMPCQRDTQGSKPSTGSRSRGTCRAARLVRVIDVLGGALAGCATQSGTEGRTAKPTCRCHAAGRDAARCRAACCHAGYMSTWGEAQIARPCGSHKGFGHPRPARRSRLASLTRPNRKAAGASPPPTPGSSDKWGARNSVANGQRLAWRWRRTIAGP